MAESKNPFEIDFDSYILQSEPEQQENGKLWQTAIGLQQVDGLTPSKYLYETAKRNIDGEITIEEAKQLIDSYYETRKGDFDRLNHRGSEDDAEEADKVSVRIREILAEKTFSFTPDLLLSIHKRLFSGVFKSVRAGYFRDYNISKREWVLDGESVLYANADMIRQTLEYDFGQEKAFDYSKISKEDAVAHLTRFIANIWQIHPFGEGNTRTTAVFTIKYLNSLGFEVNNEPFEKNSWYFRNALVRANYTNMNKGIYMNTEYLEKFFRNLLLGEKNELKNRYCHIKYNEKVADAVTPKVTVIKRLKMIEIRTARPEDAGRLLEIYSYYVKNTAISFEYEVPSLEEFRERIVNISEKYPYICAICDGVIIGYAYAGVFHAREAYKHSVELSIYVDLERRRGGCGRALYDALEERLKAQGIRNLYACIAVPPKKADEYLTFDSMKFHKKMGFKLAGHFHACGKKFDRWYDMIYMEKII